MDVVEMRYEALQRYRLAANETDHDAKSRLKAEGNFLTKQADRAAAALEGYLIKDNPDAAQKGL